jgi:hypothetical protein
MASAAVPETVRQISPAIPLGALAGIRLKGAPIEKQDIPAGDEMTKVERKNQIVGGSGAANCRSAHQERINRTSIVISSMREMIVGESRIKIPSFAIDASRIERANAASDHVPMPVSASGVMLVEKIVPNGVGRGNPPANGLLGSAVWQVLQPPIAAKSAPPLMVWWSLVDASPAEIGAIAERQVHASRKL